MEVSLDKSEGLLGILADVGLVHCCEHSARNLEPPGQVIFSSPADTEAAGYRVARIVREGYSVPPWEWRKQRK